MRFSGSKAVFFVIAVFIIGALLLVSCSGFSTQRIRRDIDTTGYKYQVFYTTGAGKTENQGVLVVDAGGRDIAKLTFGNIAGSRFELLQRFNLQDRVDETLGRMTQYDTSEDIFDIRSASFIVQRFFGQDGTDLVVLKSEMRFGRVLMNFVNKLNDQDFEISSFYTATVGRNEELSGAELAQRAKPWFLKLTYKTVVSNDWSPYSVAIADAKMMKLLPANWAQMNESFDEAIVLARELVKDLERNGWSRLSPEQGVLYKATSNPTRFFDVLGFETSYDGWILQFDGSLQRYRIVPQYNILHLNNFLDWWYGKQNSRNRSLEAVVIEFEEQGRYVPKAVAYFIKNRWAKNGLYVFDRIGRGEAPESVIRRGYDLIDKNIPDDILNAWESSDIDRVAMWFADQPPFDLSQLNADFAAVVDVVDTTEVFSGSSSEGRVTVKGVPSKKGTYHISGDVNAVVYFNALLGEHAVEMLDLGYIQPRGGDGIGFISNIVRLVERYNSGLVDYNDAAMLDQRAQESPDMARQAIQYFR